MADDKEQTWRTNISMNEQTCRHGLAWGFSWPCTVAPHSTVCSFPAVAKNKRFRLVLVLVLVLVNSTTTTTNKLRQTVIGDVPILC